MDEDGDVRRLASFMACSSAFHEDIVYCCGGRCLFSLPSFYYLCWPHFDPLLLFYSPLIPLLFTVILQWVSIVLKSSCFGLQTQKSTPFLRRKPHHVTDTRHLWGTCICPDVGKYNITTIIKHYFRIIGLRI